MSAEDQHKTHSIGYSQRLQAWRNYHKFIEDPFASFEAEREGACLPNIFVERAYFANVMGDPSQPQTAILVARRGEGKTATREMIAYNCNVNKKQHRALPIRYFDFSYVLDQVQDKTGQIEARQHVTAIIRAGLHELSRGVPLSYFQLIQGFDRELLMGYVQKFADPIIKMRLQQILSVEPVSLAWDALTAQELLSHFVNLVTQLGASEADRFKSVYVLVDRVDESRLGTKEAINILSSLVREGPLLNLSGLAFKFFLPVEVGYELTQIMAARPDRVVNEKITWDEPALGEIVNIRLQEFSRHSIEKLEDLCDLTIKRNVMDRLIRAADRSPRMLLRLCRNFIQAHIQHNDAGSFYLNSKDLTEALLTPDDDHQRAVEETSLIQAQSEPSEHGLFIDKSGHIYIDAREIKERPSGLVLELLKVLYRLAPDIVPSQDLINTLWPGGAVNSDEQNLRKLVNRLRQCLSAASPEEDREFIKTVRGRGYWMDINA